MGLNDVLNESDPMDRVFMFFMIILMLGPFGFIGLFNFPLLAVPILVLTVVALASMVGIVVLRTRMPYNTSGGRVPSWWYRLMGFDILGCGCVYSPGAYSWSKWAKKPGAESTEHQYVWFRSREGARIRFEKYREELVRCKQCGRHRYRYTKVKRTVVEYWEDDLDATPDDDLEILTERPREG